MPITSGGWDTQECLGALLSVSFTGDPFVRWLMPKSLDFIRDCKMHPRRACAAAFDAGTVFVIGDFAGAAVWLPPGTKKDHAGENAPAAPSLVAADPDFPPEFPELMSQSAAFCPCYPHWYLGLIAVDPAFRGRGVGAKLMEHCLAIVDQDEQPAYLESTNATNLSLYRRLGFQELAKVHVGSSPARYPMLRMARKQGS